MAGYVSLCSHTFARQMTTYFSARLYDMIYLPNRTGYICIKKSMQTFRSAFKLHVSVNFNVSIWVASTSIHIVFQHKLLTALCLSILNLFAICLRASIWISCCNYLPGTNIWAAWPIAICFVLAGSSPCTTHLTLQVRTVILIQIQIQIQNENRNDPNGKFLRKHKDYLHSQHLKLLIQIHSIKCSG